MIILVVVTPPLELLMYVKLLHYCTLFQQLLFICSRWASLLYFFLTNIAFQTLLTASVRFRVKPSSLCVSLFEQASCCHSVFCIIHISTLQTPFTCDFYMNFTFSSGASELTQIVFSQLVCCGIL